MRGASEPDAVFRFPPALELAPVEGVRCLLVERHDLPLVSLRVTLRAGALAEGGAHGAAYALSQLLEEGAGPRDALALAAALQQIGASIGTWSDGDTTCVGFQVLRRHLDRALDLAFDVLLRPALDGAGWRRVRSELVDRARGRRAEPEQLATLALRRACYGEHPYGRPTLPLVASIAELRLPALRRLHRAICAPDRAIIVAAGDVTAAELERKLERRLAGWSRAARGATAAPAAVRAPSTPPPRSRCRLALGLRPGASQSVLRVGQLGPARRDADFAATKVLNTILGGSFTSRLNLNLRERHGFTYGARSTFSLPREAGLFAVKTAVGTADTLAALREIFRELERIRARPPSREEVERARQLQLEALPATAETIEGLVDTYSTIALHDLPLDALATQPAELAAVTPACVRDLARRLLAPARMTVVVLGDVERLAPALAREHGPTLLLDEDGQPIRRRPGGSSASRARPRRRPRAARGSAG